MALLTSQHAWYAMNWWRSCAQPSMGAAMSTGDGAVAGEGVAAGAEAEGVMQTRCSAFEISKLTAAVCPTT